MMDDYIGELVLTVIHLQPSLDSSNFHAPVLLSTCARIHNISQDTHYPFCNGICMVKSSKQDNTAEILNGICMVGVQNKTIQQRFHIISDRNCCTLW